MGLDQWLTKETYVGNKWKKKSEMIKVKIPKKQNNVAFPIGGIKDEKIQTITEEIGCWRKANAIHKWFVENVQNGEDDCGKYVVNQAQMEKLLKLCDTIIANPGMAHKILPTEDGFYFGSTDYDEYYHQDIKDTKTILEEALKDLKLGCDIYYSSSW